MQQAKSVSLRSVLQSPSVRLCRPMHGWMYGMRRVWMHMCVSMCVYVCMKVGMHECMSVCMYVCMYVSIYLSTYGIYIAPLQYNYSEALCMYVHCRPTCMYVCIYVCMYV